MGVAIRILLLTLLFISPLYAQGASSVFYDRCLQTSSILSCEPAFLDPQLTREQRDIIREHLDPSYISKLLSYLQDDAAGDMARFFGERNGMYDLCIDGNNSPACATMLASDLLNSERRRIVHRKLERLKPGYIQTLIDSLSGQPEPQIAQANPPPATQRTDNPMIGYCLSDNLWACEQALLDKRLTSQERAAVQEKVDKAEKERLSRCQSGNQFACRNVLSDPKLPQQQRQAVQTRLAQAERDKDNANIFSLIFGIAVILGITGIVLAVKAKRRANIRSEFAKLPLDGPMQVNIEETYAPAGSFNSKHVPCGLNIEVIISQKDWKALADAGLMKKVLFYGDGLSGAQYDPDNVRPWLVQDLKRPTRADFWDADRMLQAKETLVESLYNLRDHIDNQRHPSKKETLQI